METRRAVLDQEVIDRIQRSELLHVDDLLPILQDAVHQLENYGAEVIFIDGFPRQIGQVMAEGRSTLRPHLVLFFDCPREIAKERYLVRALAGRDSNPEVFARRYEEFAQSNRLLVQEYAGRGVLLAVSHGQQCS